MNDILTTSPVFYANHLRVLKVTGDYVRCQYSHYWDAKDLRATVTITQIVDLGGFLHTTLIDRFGMIPDNDFINDFLSDTDDLDYYLGDDCNSLISASIQEGMRNTLNIIE